MKDSYDSYGYPVKPLQAPLEYTRPFVERVEVDVPAEKMHTWYPTNELRFLDNGWDCDLQQKWKRLPVTGMGQGWTMAQEEVEWRYVSIVRE